MSCILRICGDELDVDALLRVVVLVPDRVWRRGEPRQVSKPEGRHHENSGVTFVASNSDFRDFNQQIDEATCYLDTHRVQIAAMASFVGVQQAILDFGIELRDVAIHCDILPLRFLEAAVKVGVSVVLSHYPCCDNENQSEQIMPPNGP